MNPSCCSHVSIYPVIDTPKVPSLSTPSSPFPGLGIYSAREGLCRGPLGHDVLPNRTDAIVTNTEIIWIFGFGSDDNQLDRGKNRIRIRGGIADWDSDINLDFAYLLILMLMSMSMDGDAAHAVFNFPSHYRPYLAILCLLPTVPTWLPASCLPLPNPYTIR